MTGTVVAVVVVEDDSAGFVDDFAGCEELSNRGESLELPGNAEEVADFIDIVCSFWYIEIARFTLYLR